MLACEIVVRVNRFFDLFQKLFLISKLGNLLFALAEFLVDGFDKCIVKLLPPQTRSSHACRVALDACLSLGVRQLILCCATGFFLHALQLFQGSVLGGDEQVVELSLGDGVDRTCGGGGMDSAGAVCIGAGYGMDLVRGDGDGGGQMVRHGKGRWRAAERKRGLVGDVKHVCSEMGKKARTEKWMAKRAER